MRSATASPIPLDWLTVIFNPTFPAALRAHGRRPPISPPPFVVMAVGARHLLKQRFTRPVAHHGAHGARHGAGAGARCRSLIGDQHGLQTREVPAGQARGHRRRTGTANEAGAACALRHGRTSKAERNDFEIAIPRLGSFIITHDWNGIYPGLKAFAGRKTGRRCRPCSSPSASWSGIGFTLIALGLVGACLWWRGALFTTRASCSRRRLGHGRSASSPSSPAGSSTEIGRQPWIATGILRTADAASPVPAEHVASTLAPLRRRLRHRLRAPASSTSTA